jgi:hypothetical protein
MPVFGRQLRVPEQPPPDQPLNRDPGEGVAVSVNEVPASNEAEQLGPQWIPVGRLDTVPEPVPFFEMCRVTEAGEPPTSRPAG